MTGELFRPVGEAKTYFKKISGLYNDATFEVDVNGLHVTGNSQTVMYDFETGFVSFGDLSFRSEKSVMGYIRH